jgi:hypothetical protein
VTKKKQAEKDLPMTTVGFAGSVRIAADLASGMVLIPPSLTFTLQSSSQRALVSCKERRLLEEYVGEVLRFCVADLRGLEALRRDAGLDVTKAAPLVSDW